jgi:uncharacterized lipoprotein YajG
MFEPDCLSEEFLMSTDETAIDMMLLKYLNEDVTQGAVPFLLKSKVYNTVHGYTQNGEDAKSQVTKKRYFLKYMHYVLVI